MGRGPSLKTELKKTKKRMETEAKTKWKLLRQKPIFLRFQEVLGEIASNTSLMDVAKFGAIIGTTFLVKRAFDITEDLRAGVDDLLGTLAQVPKFLYELPAPKRWGEFWGDKGLGLLVFPNVIEWLLAFCIAYVIVEHFGDIMHAGGNVLSSVTSMARGMIL